MFFSLQASTFADFFSFFLCLSPMKKATKKVHHFSLLIALCGLLYSSEGHSAFYGGNDLTALTANCDRKAFGPFADRRGSGCQAKLWQSGIAGKLMTEVLPPLYQDLEARFDLPLCSDTSRELPNWQPHMDCSGFLVGQNILMTTAHCVNETSCTEDRWQFSDGVVRRCQNVLQWKLLRKVKGYQDYALIELEEEKWSSQKPARWIFGLPSKGQWDVLKQSLNAFASTPSPLPWANIGHPLGLDFFIQYPLRVWSNSFFKDRTFFISTLDAFAGQSGSPLIDMKTGMAYGMVMRGRNDFYIDEEANCVRFERCELSGRLCEDDQSSSSFPGEWALILEKSFIH
jgi:hypothetical protein